MGKKHNSIVYKLPSLFFYSSKNGPAQMKTQVIIIFFLIQSLEGIRCSDPYL